MNYYERVAKTVGLTLLLVTLVGTAIALVVHAPDAFFLIYLSILFAVLLAHLAAYLQRWLPLGYSWNLAIVVLLLIAGTIASGFLFGSAVKQQAQRTSQQLDQASEKLGELLQREPTVRQVLVGIPVLGRAVEELTGKKEQPPAEQTQKSADELSSIANAEGQRLEATRTNEPAENDSADAEQANAVSSNSGSATADPADGESAEPEKPQPAPENAETPSLTNQELPSQALSILGRIFSTTFGALTSLAIVIFVGLFLAVDPKLYSKGLLGLFSPPYQPRAADILRRLDHVLFRWLVGRILTMSITGVGTGLGLWALGVPLAGTVGAITALLCFIPNLGAVLALFLAMLAALPQGPTTVMWVVGLYLLLQLVESNVITPLIQQHQTSIPPALLIAFQLLVGMLTGFIGLIVATPLLAALMVIIDELWYTEPSDVL